MTQTNPMLSRVLKIKFPLWTIVLALMFLCVLAFGLLIPYLGFYWDDWNPVLVEKLFGTAKFWEFYSYDRPLSAWTYVIVAPLLNGTYLNWQVFTLIMRWVSAIGMFWTFSGVWPRAKRPLAAAAMLFVVYPVFTQQPISVTYHQLWVEYALFFASMGFMVHSLRKVNYYLPFTGLALLSMILNFTISEYFIGLELLRPILISMILAQSISRLRPSLIKIIKIWMPYLIILLAYIIWRLFFAQISGGDPNKPYLLYQLFSKPLTALFSLANIILPDMVRILLTTWSNALKPELFALDKPFFLFSWGIGTLAALFSYFYISRLKNEIPLENPQPENWSRQAIIIGILATALGPFPAWITGRQLSGDMFTDRFAAAAMFGASLFIVGMVEWFIRSPKQKLVIISLLIGLATGSLLRSANDYRWFWMRQSRFYWQLAWRAPYIKPDTPILAKDDVFPEQGRFATSIALNLVYPQQLADEYVAYWVFSLNKGLSDQVETLKAGFVLKDKFRFFSFEGKSNNSLVIEQSEDHCLWVLDPNGPRNLDLPEIVSVVVPLSNMERIVAEPTEPGYPPENTFGKEQTGTWCYFYEKGDLARQSGDWNKVVQIADEVRNMGFIPGVSEARTPYEWYPFIEGYARHGRWADVNAIILDLLAHKRNSKLDSQLCVYLQWLMGRVSQNADGKQATNELSSQLQCSSK